MNHLYIGVAIGILFDILLEIALYFIRAYRRKRKERYFLVWYSVMIGRELIFDQCGIPSKTFLSIGEFKQRLIEINVYPSNCSIRISSIDEFKSKDDFLNFG